VWIVRLGAIHRLGSLLGESVRELGAERLVEQNSASGTFTQALKCRDCARQGTKDTPFAPINRMLCGGCQRARGRLPTNCKALLPMK